MNTIIEKIRAEIERRTNGEQGYNSEDSEFGYKSCARELLAKLSDLEKEEKPSEGLEEEMERFIETFGWGKTKHLAEKELISATARHFAKWGAEHAKECEEKPNKVKADFDIYRFQQKFCIHCEIPHCTGTIDYLKSCPYLNK